ncbi:MAG: leucine-rich repeat domain-containing protein [Bacteroidia bacterium]
MQRIFLTIVVLLSFTGFLSAQVDSMKTESGMSANPELAGPTSPLLNPHQLEREKWFYSMDEAMRQPEKVFKLSLKNKKLKYIPAEISRFPNLQVLNLSENKLKTLPDELADLQHLQVLILTNNKIKNLPDSMRELENLTQLYLGRNQLVEMPAWVGGFSKLRTLDLSFNLLTTYEIELVAARLPKCNVTH